jgi:hypothetical protein
MLKRGLSKNVRTVITQEFLDGFLALHSLRPLIHGAATF